ncbi:MAG: hypothetical protein L6Q84_13660 [Polyangiaceae bacterium]|nr:hypothetical protein [Polyangiaceae bacterium]
MQLWKAFALPLIAALTFAPVAGAQGTAAPKAGAEAKPGEKTDAKKPDEAKADPKDAKKEDAKKADPKKADPKKPDEAKKDEAKKPDEAKPATDAAKPAEGEKKPEVAADPTKPSTPKASTTGGQMDGPTYQVRLRELEARVDELKEQIRRSHTRLSLLSETILSGGVGGARAEVKFTNDMSSVFRLNRALFVLDGAVQYNKQDDTGALAAQKEIPIFAGSVPPGDHTLQVLLQFQGHGYGVFSYLRGYRFEVKSSHSFTVTEGKTMELEAIAYEKGGVTTPVEQRPAVRFVEKLRTGGTSASPAGGGSGGNQKSGLSGSFSFGSGGK